MSFITILAITNITLTNGFKMSETEKLAELFKALSDPTRLKVVKLLNGSAGITLNNCTPETCTGKGGPMCVNALTNKLGVSQSAVSQHLRILRQAGIVQGDRKGAFVHYSINQENFKRIKAMIRDELGELFS